MRKEAFEWKWRIAKRSATVLQVALTRNPLKFRFVAHRRKKKLMAAMTLRTRPSPSTAAAVPSSALSRAPAAQTTSLSAPPPPPHGCLHLHHRPNCAIPSEAAHRGQTALDRILATASQRNDASQRRLASRSWRNRVPFAVPVNPTFLSFDPRLVSSTTERLTHDRGVVYCAANDDDGRSWPMMIGSTAAAAALCSTGGGITQEGLGGGASSAFGTFSAAASAWPSSMQSSSSLKFPPKTINYNVDRGVAGLSLQKQSRQYLLSTVDTFPGIFPNIPGGPSARSAMGMAC